MATWMRFSRNYSWQIRVQKAWCKTSIKAKKKLQSPEVEFYTITNKQRQIACYWPALPFIRLDIWFYFHSMSTERDRENRDSLSHLKYKMSTNYWTGGFNRSACIHQNHSQIYGFNFCKINDYSSLAIFIFRNIRGACFIGGLSWIRIKGREC